MVNVGIKHEEAAVVMRNQSLLI
jgi:hypothetical protein